MYYKVSLQWLQSEQEVKWILQEVRLVISHFQITTINLTISYTVIYLYLFLEYIIILMV